MYRVRKFENKNKVVLNDPGIVRVKILNVYFLIMHQNEQHKRKKKAI